MSTDQSARAARQAREDEATLAEAFVPCAGCGKELQNPKRADNLRSYLHRHPGDDALRLRAETARVGAVAPTSSLGAPDTAVIVCPHRDQEFNHACRLKAVERLGTCLLCGCPRRIESTREAPVPMEVLRRRPFPEPCGRCVEYVRQGQQRAAADAARGDAVPTRVVPIVQGLSSSDARGEPELRPVFVSLLAAFGVAEVKASPVETVRHDPPIAGGYDDKYDATHAPVFVLDGAQRAALSGLLRWLNVAVPTALAERYRSGSQILTQLIRGDLTVDQMNDKVAGEVKRRASDADHAAGGGTR